MSRIFRLSLMVVALEFLAVSLTPGIIQAEEDAAKKGLEIAVKVDKADKGFKDQHVELVMTLKDAHGRESVRHMRTKTLEVDGDGDKVLIVFDRPRSVAGTKFLSFTHKSGADDQWLYLPKLKRVKRISSNNKSGPFMGSEFAFEDIASVEVEQYTYRFLRDEEYKGQACHVVEFDPVDENSGYSKQEVWIDQDRLIPLQTDFYDVKNMHVKKLTFDGYKQYQGKFWRAAVMHMVNLQTKKSTRLEFTNYKFGNSFSKRDFDIAALKRAR